MARYVDRTSTTGSFSDEPLMQERRIAVAKGKSEEQQKERKRNMCAGLLLLAILVLILLLAFWKDDDESHDDDTKVSITNSSQTTNRKEKPKFMDDSHKTEDDDPTDKTKVKHHDKRDEDEHSTKDHEHDDDAGEHGETRSPEVEPTNNNNDPNKKVPENNNPDGETKPKPVVKPVETVQETKKPQSKVYRIVKMLFCFVALVCFLCLLGYSIYVLATKHDYLEVLGVVNNDMGFPLLAWACLLVGLIGSGVFWRLFGRYSGLRTYTRF